MSQCKWCDAPLKVSSGPGRMVGAISRTIQGIYAPLPDDFHFEYCPRCNRRNMTPELKERLWAIEDEWLVLEQRLRDIKEMGH